MNCTDHAQVQPKHASDLSVYTMTDLINTTEAWELNLGTPQVPSDHVEGIDAVGRLSLARSGCASSEAIRQMVRELASRMGLPSSQVMAMTPGDFARRWEASLLRRVRHTATA